MPFKRYSNVNLHATSIRSYIGTMEYNRCSVRYWLLTKVHFHIQPNFCYCKDMKLKEKRRYCIVLDAYMATYIAYKYTVINKTVNFPFYKRQFCSSVNCGLCGGDVSRPFPRAHATSGRIIQNKPSNGFS